MALRDRRLAQLALFAALAVVHTWPLAAAPATWSRLDNADTALNAWILAWVAHQLPVDPRHLFDAPIFYPEPRTLAFSEHMVVQGVLGLPLFAFGLSAVTVYNVLALVGFALSGLAMALVVERWTGSLRAGLVAGMAYAFNAHTLTRFGHMQALHVQFLPLALAALHDLIDRPAWRAAWRLCAWITLQALTSNYLLVMSAVAALTSAVSAPRAWFGAAGRRRLLRLGAAAAVAGVVLLPFLLPYYDASTKQGLVRPFDEVALYSGSWRDYAATGGRLHYAWWSHRFFAGRTPLFPGVTVLVLAAVALLQRDTWRAHRTRAMIVLAAAGALLSLGASLPGYHWLYDHLPPLRGIRGAVRFGWLSLLALAVLAGAGLAHLERRWPRRAAAIAATAAVVVTVEAARTPMTFTRFDGVPPIYAHVAALPADAVLLEFPFPDPAMLPENGPYMIAATSHFRPMLNGYSGFTPASYFLHAAVARRFPSDEAAREFGYLGVTHVVFHGDRMPAAIVEAMERIPGITLVAREGADRLYALPRPTP